MTKKVRISEQFEGANILGCTVHHNGYCGGDRGHGGYVTIKFENICGTAMLLNGKDVESFEFAFCGDSERDTLIDALNFILTELKKDQR